MLVYEDSCENKTCCVWATQFYNWAEQAGLLDRIRWAETLEEAEAGNIFRGLPGTAEKMREIEYLDMSGCGIEYLPSEVMWFEGVKHLNLSNNSLEIFPPWDSECLGLSGLDGMERLDLSNNKISSIDGIADMHAMYLTEIDISNNRLGKLPRECISNLSHKTMVFSQGNLTVKEVSLLDSVEKRGVGWADEIEGKSVIEDQESFDIFSRIEDDLRIYIASVGDRGDVVVRGGYGIARRIVSLALLVQGKFTVGEYKHAEDMCLNLIDYSGQKYSEESSEAMAFEYLQSYDERLNRRFWRNLSNAGPDELTANLDRGEVVSSQEILDQYSERESRPGVVNDFVGESSGGGVFKRLNVVPLGMMIESIGMGRVAEVAAHDISSFLSRDDLRQFILEELDAAYQGNEKARNFARFCGVPENEFMGAMNRSNARVERIQGEFIRLCMQLMKDMDQMVDFRCHVGEILLKQYWQ